jgi:TRAP transporter 4TM/12TM fusion protein
MGTGYAGGNIVRIEKAAGIIAGLAALYQLFMASRILTWLGYFIPDQQHKAVCLMFALTLIYALIAGHGRKRKGYLGLHDALFLAAGLIGSGFVVFRYEAILDYSLDGFLDIQGIILCLLLAVSLFEAVRRLTGLALPIIVLVFLLATVFQNHLPGLLYGKGFDLDRLGFALYVGRGGIFGVPLGVATTILITYIIFGRLMQDAGAGRFFIDLALAVTGWMRGGVAKATIFASCLFGMITGSPSAEVATVGSISIPMMIQTGYTPRFAAAVEAVAGTGGQFMPPVMGAIAFIMAEWIGVSYGKIAVAAFIPATLYFFVLFVSIHFEAAKLGLKPVPRTNIPSSWRTFKRGYFYLLPLAVLIYLLMARNFPPEMAGLYSSLVLVAVSFMSPDKKHHLRPSRLWVSLKEGTKTWIVLAGVTATVGMLIGALELSGLGIKFSSFILDLTQGSLLLTLVLIGLASFILGMGLDSIPAYITLVILAAPALIKMGVPVMVAHLYVIYWGLASFITPPVCLAVYVACGISGTKIWETGWEAVRLGICVFVIPFAFVYNQALLAQGTGSEILAAVVTATLGGILVAASNRGFFLSPLGWWRRGAVFAGGLVLIGPTTVWTTLIGLALGGAGLIGSRRTEGQNVDSRAHTS